MNPYDKARELAKALKESPAAISFKEAKKAVESDEGAKKMIEDFELKRMAIQKKQLAGEEISEEDNKNLQELYEIIALNTLANAYLSAEYQLSIQMQEISKIISESIID